MLETLGWSVALVACIGAGFIIGVNWASHRSGRILSSMTGAGDR
jgi:hypothetical protein